MTALEMMDRSPKAVVDFLLAMYERQTGDEQQTGSTREENGVGFNGTDARFLSSLAEQALENRRTKKFPTDLSPKQIECAKKKLVKYTRQLEDILAYRMAVKKAADPNWTLERTVMTAEGRKTIAQTAILQVDAMVAFGLTEGVPYHYHPLPDHLEPKRAARMEVAEEQVPFPSTIGWSNGSKVVREKSPEGDRLKGAPMIHSGSDTPTADAIWDALMVEAFEEGQ
jgi:hypothetical protein